MKADTLPTPRLAADDTQDGFVVVELDERLEFMECCDINRNCSCLPPASPPPPPVGDET